MDDDLVVPGMSEREIYIRRRVKRLAEFYRHVVVFVIVISLLWTANYFMIAAQTKRSIWYWWAMWPTVGWGIGVLAHGLSVLPHLAFFSLEWEEKKVRELMRESDGERLK